MRLIVALLLTVGCSYEPVGLLGPGDSTIPGDDVSGDPTPGDAVSGDPTSGDTNSGDTNSGDTNSGDSNSGDPVTGDSSSGDTVCPPAVAITAPAEDGQWQNGILLEGVCATSLGDVSVYGDIEGTPSVSCQSGTFAVNIELIAPDGSKTVSVEQGAGGACLTGDSRGFERKFCSQGALVGSGYPAGNGSSALPYRICTEAQLLAYANDLYARSVFALLSDDITLTGSGVSNLGPIGLSGTFDGGGHTVSKLRHTYPNNRLGMFGTVSGGTVKNLVISEATISGVEISGAVVGQATNGATLSNLTVINSSVLGSLNNIGGIVGTLNGSTLDNCAVVNTTVKGTNHVGGIAGGVRTSASVTHSWSEADVSGADAVGGIAGIMDAASISQSFTRAGTIAAEVGAAGGIVGVITSGAVSDSYSLCRVDGLGAAGGIAGTADVGAIERCHHTLGSINGPNTAAGGIFGASTPSTSSADSYYTGTYAVAGGTELTSVQMASQATFGTWDFVTVWVMSTAHPILSWQ